MALGPTRQDDRRGQVPCSRGYLTLTGVAIGRAVA